MENDIAPADQKKKIKLVKISRNGIVVFLKRNLIVFSVVILLIVSLLLGVWNISKYEVYDKSGGEIDSKVSKMIEKYVSENIIGKNFFKVNSTSLSELMPKNISYVESVRIEKVVPNKIIIFTEIYTPKLVAVLKSSKCSLLSEKGYLLEELCKDSDENCCTEYAQKNSLYIFSSKDVDVANLGNGKSRLLVMEDVYKIVKAIQTYSYDIKTVKQEENMLNIVTTNDKKFVFSFSDDIDIQLQRLVVVMNKIVEGGLKFKSLDLRFERPVMKN